MRRVALLAVLAAVLAVPAPAPAAPGLQTIMQDDANLLFRSQEQRTAAVRRMKALGVDRVRVTAYWSSLTRAADDDARPAFDARDPAAYEQFRFAGLDAAVRAIRAAGMHVLLDVGFWAPAWAAAETTGPRARTSIDPDAFGDFARALAVRYSGGFVPPADPPAPQPEPAPSADQSLLEEVLGPVPVLPELPLDPARRSARAAQAAAALPSVDGFALFNEPNHQGLLLPQWDGPGAGAAPASPAVYRAMVRAAYPAIKSVRPRAQVLIGNTSSTGGRRGAGPVAPLEFLRTLACVDAALRPLTTPACAGFQTLPGDGWAHHPYSQNEKPTRRSDPAREPGDVRIADLPELARTLQRLVDAKRLSPANRFIWITEFGYESEPILGRPTISEATQARWLTWAEYVADRVPAVRSFAQFLLLDQAPAAGRVTSSAARPGGQFYTGLLRPNGTPKPAARSFVAGLFAERRARGRVMLYVRLRLGAGVKAIDVQRRAGRGPWRRIARVNADGQAAFTRTVRHVPGARYRLTYPRAGGRRAAGRSVAAVPAQR